MLNENFINKKCRVTYLSGFVLEGIIREADTTGIILETKQKTSFISIQTIRDIQQLVEQQ